jgi:hypothetical protein
VEGASTLSEILAQLPVKQPLLVPDELLALWFPPGVVNGRIDSASAAAATRAAEANNCTFDYAEDEQVGRFWKRETNN